MVLPLIIVCLLEYMNDAGNQIKSPHPLFYFKYSLYLCGMKTHLITTLILIGLLTLCVGMAMSYYVLMGVMGTVILASAYCGVYLIVSRNMTTKNK